MRTCLAIKDKRQLRVLQKEVRATISVLEKLSKKKSYKKFIYSAKLKRFQQILEILIALEENSEQEI